MPRVSEPLELMSLFPNVLCDEVNGTPLLHGILKVTTSLLFILNVSALFPRQIRLFGLWLKI